MPTSSKGPRPNASYPASAGAREASARPARRDARRSSDLALAATRGASLAEDGTLLAEDGTSLYVHLPFCTSRCNYCDFNAHAWQGEDLDRHVDALLAEARQRARDLRPQTVFLGGGTPSLLAPQQLQRLLDGLDAITGFRASALEVTMEANPESFDEATAAAARAGGVDRMSIGVQSLRADVLRAYDRAHDPQQALQAIARAQHAGFRRINADLIYAFPGQDPSAWHEDVDALLDTGVEHLSCYELSYEPGTPLTHARAAGAWREEDDARCLSLFQDTRAQCAARGLGAYEVSAFAAPGAASRHNLAYWRSLDWVGLGAGASGWRLGERRRNLARPDRYEAAVEAGRDPVAERERPDACTALFDHFMMGLRLPGEGVLLARARRQTGLDPAEAWGATWESLFGEGLLEEADLGDGPRVRATPRGLIFLDDVLQRLLPVQEV